MNNIDWSRFEDITDLTKIEQIKTHNQKIINSIPIFREYLLQNNFELYVEVLDKYTNILNFIISFHDIGKIYSDIDHEYESCNIIKRMNLIPQGLLKNDLSKDVFRIIENHTLLGGVFTGEYAISRLEKLIMELSDEMNILFSVFSALDVAGYVDNMSYVFRLFRNYTEIISEIKKKNFHFFDYHLKWRLGCLLACYKTIDYDDKISLNQYIEKLNYYYYKFNVDLSCSIYEYYSFLLETDLHYAIWLFGRLAYYNDKDYQSADVDKIDICQGFFSILNEIKSLGGERWNVYFYGYRKNQQFAEQVFHKIRYCYDENIFTKTIDDSRKRIIYKINNTEKEYS